MKDRRSLSAHGADRLGKATIRLAPRGSGAATTPTALVWHQASARLLKYRRMPHHSDRNLPRRRRLEPASRTHRQHSSPSRFDRALPPGLRAPHGASTSPLPFTRFQLRNCHPMMLSVLLLLRPGSAVTHRLRSLLRRRPIAEIAYQCQMPHHRCLLPRISRHSMIYLISAMFGERRLRFRKQQHRRGQSFAPPTRELMQD